MAEKYLCLAQVQLCDDNVDSGNSLCAQDITDPQTGSQHCARSEERYALSRRWQAGCGTGI